MIKVCMVAPIPPPYGGIANWVVLLDEYVKNVENVVFAHVNTAPKNRALDGRSLWDRVVGSGFAMFGMNKELKRCIKKDKIDVIHMTTSGQLAIIRDIMMLKTAKRKKIPSVYHIHFGRIPQISKENTREWKMIKKAMLLATKVIAIDTTTLHAIRQYAPDVNVCYVPNPFDMHKLEGMEQTLCEAKRKEIIFVGWVVKTKGVEELLAAWQQIHTSYPDWTLRIVGPYASDYLAELQSRFATEQVIFDGEKKHDEAMKSVTEAEIFILPSYTEGFPNAVLEAMALKKPIIATDVGAIPDMLKGCGIVIPAQNTKAVVRALEQLLTDEALRCDLGKKARERLECKYTIEKVFDAYTEIWSEVQT